MEKLSEAAAKKSCRLPRIENGRERKTTRWTTNCNKINQPGEYLVKKNISEHTDHKEKRRNVKIMINKYKEQILTEFRETLAENYNEN